MEWAIFEALLCLTDRNFDIARVYITHLAFHQMVISPLGSSASQAMPLLAAADKILDDEERAQYYSSSWYQVVVLLLVVAKNGGKGIVQTNQ